jgi:hypothetical protein
VATPARLVPLDDPLPAPAAGTIADLVLAHPGGIVVAHGPPLIWKRWI